MNKISRKNKMKATAILASIVWGATVLTGCPSSVDENEPEPTPTPTPIEVVYPDTITSADKSTISNLSSASLAASLNSIDTIITILTKHSSENGIAEYISNITKVRDAIKSGNLAILGTNGIENYTKTIDALDTNYTSLSQYATALDAKTSYETYRDNDFKNARDAYVSAIENIPMDNYNKVVEVAKDVVEDFKDNYIFNGTYDETQVKADVAAAKADQASISDEKAAYDTAYSTVDGKYNAAVSAKTAYDNAISAKKAEEAQAAQEAELAKVKNVTITSASDMSSIDWTRVESIKVAVADGATSVDVAALREVYDAAVLQASANGKDSVVSFGDYPETVTKFVIKDNINLMNMVSEPDFTNANEGDNLYTDLVPGIKVLSNLAVAYASGNKNIQKALSFTDTTKKVDLSSTDYSLTGTYKGGIVGNVEFENLAKTKISGTIEGKSNISPFYDTFVKNTSAENLPSLSLDFEGFDADFGDDVALGGTYVNMYGTNIDKIVSKYYDNGKTMELSGGSMSFNAKEKLGSESMYTSNVYNNNAYNLDINAALVMNPLIANVNVVGNRNSNVPTELSQSLTNVRFESDLNGVSLTGAERGVIEFAGDAPDSSFPSGTKTIFKKVSRETILNSAGLVDVSALSETEVARLKSTNSASTITELITSSSDVKPAGFIIEKTVVGAENATYSAQDYEKTGNQGKEHPSQADLSYALPKKNVKPTKSDLIRAILDENQKQYS
ncbi:MAG: hypothetical protein IJ638_03165 [Alphaproteobacteria bacterium]|nr:hypothetical protein [Alphaproteobacteria bacterium]